MATKAFGKEFCQLQFQTHHAGTRCCRHPKAIHRRTQHKVWNKLTHVYTVYTCYRPILLAVNVREKAVSSDRSAPCHKLSHPELQSEVKGQEAMQCNKPEFQSPVCAALARMKRFVLSLLHAGYQASPTYNGTLELKQHM